MASRMSGMISDYQKMYDAIKNWDKSPSASQVDEPGHYIYGMEWAIGDMGFHGWDGAAGENERRHFEEVKKAHKALKTALESALGIDAEVLNG